MQIVIELNDNEYAELNEIKEDHPGALSWSAKRILDGTVLPEKHGPLVDLIDIHNSLNMYMYNIDGIHAAIDEETDIILEGTK